MTRAMSDAAVDAAAPTRELHYEGFPLEAVLARIHAAHGTDVTITSADRCRRGGIAGFFARELFQVTVAVPAPEAVAEPDGDESPRLNSLGVSVFGTPHPTAPGVEVLDPRPDSELDFNEIDPEDVEGALGLDLTSRRDGADDEVWSLLAADMLASSTGGAAAVVAPTRVDVVAPIVSSGPIASTTLIPAAFVSPGASGLAGAIDVAGLAAGFDSVGPVPTVPSAGIVAIVGTRSDAARVAGALAERCGIPTDDVIVASPPDDLVVPTADEALRLAASTRFRCTPLAVVVVELLPGRQGHEWVRAVLDGLRAEQVRFAADTGRLVASQHLSVAAIGGVDAIDLLDANLQPEPELAIGLSAPIATIDGRPASPEMWAATVLASGRGAAIDRSSRRGR